MPQLNQPRSSFRLSPGGCAVSPVWLGGGLTLSALVWLSPAALAAMLSAWQFDPATQQLRVTLPAGVTPQYAVAVDANRIVLDIPQTQLGNVPTDATYDGPVRQITVAQLNADTVRIILEVDSAAELVPEQVQLVAIAAGEQTQWILTALTPQPSLDAPAAETNGPGMIVELPQLPADPNLSWPYTGIGRLSISASNLMLPSNLDAFNTLPETLAIDPFSLGLPEVEQVAVPSLEELDAAVGVAIARQHPRPLLPLPLSRRRAQPLRPLSLLYRWPQRPQPLSRVKLIR
ncbi:MAG: AMIN domain-containing protein [Leptolyngbyaceae cyanobacterium SM2_5_2]|nr:AMIN domain-containing protein [Leptolyngbyaceae cyanobacterium SM2_5_2]